MALFFGNPFFHAPARQRNWRPGQPLPVPPPIKRRKHPPIPKHILVIPPPNQSMDFYNSAGDPTMENVLVYLQAHFDDGQEACEASSDLQWTHLALFQAGNRAVDVRDNYPDAPNSQAFLSDNNLLTWFIIFVEKINRKTGWEGYRVYLRRNEPVWPERQL